MTFNSYYARSRTPRRRGDESSYMAQFAYAADRYGIYRLTRPYIASILALESFFRS